MQVEVQHQCIERCPVCCGNAIRRDVTRRTYAVRAFSKKIEIRFSICETCGFIFQENPLTLDALMYYYAHNGQPRDTEVHPIEHELHIKQAAFLEAYKDIKGAQLLEIGSSAGKFLTFLRAQKECVTYFDELNPEAQGHLLSHGHLPIAKSKNCFDVVVMRHVLEHIVEPCDYLRQLSTRLTPSSVVFVEVPDWSFLDAHTDSLNFEHVNHFSPTTLTRLLDRAGYVTVRLEMDRTEGYSTTPNRVIRVLARQRPEAANGGGVVASFVHHLDETEGRYYRAIDKLVAQRGPDWQLGLYAASWLAEMVLNNTSVAQLPNLRLFDKDPRKQSTLFYGLKVEAPAEIVARPPKSILILSSYERQIRDDLAKLGFSGETFSFYDLPSLL